MKPIIHSMIVTMLVLISSLPAWSAAEETQAEATDLYQGGNYAGVIRLLTAKSARSTQEALYLGLSYLRLGDQSQAIDAWKEYVHLDPGSEGARNISQYLTLLIREEAKKAAAQIVKQETAIGTRVDPNAVAVPPFRNLGQASYDPLSKGLAEMIITDLSQVEGLKVVERIRIQSLLDELKLSLSGLVDPKSAPKVGKLLGAGKITTGSYLDLTQEDIRFDAAIAQTEDGKLITSQGVSGKLATFYDLEKLLVFRILFGLGKPPESLDSRTREALERIHTKNFQAFRLYSEGLNFFDQGEYRKASQSFFFALEEDPEFELARKALLATPRIPIDLTAMISDGEAIARLELIVLGALELPPPPAAVQGLLVPNEGVAKLLLPPISQQPIPTSGAGSPATTPVTVNVTFN